MRRASHSGTHPEGCPSCITAAEKQRMPWHTSYHDVLATPGYRREIEAKHTAALRRGAARLRGGQLKF